MSKSLEHALASKEFHHSVSSMLNAEANSFAPSFSPFLYSPVHRSALRGSAPDFVAPTARLLTPHSASENNKVTIASTFDSPSHRTTSEISQDETQCYEMPVEFSMGNGIGFDTSSFDTSSEDASSEDASSESVFGQYAHEHGIFDTPTYFYNTDNQDRNPNLPIYDLFTATKENTDQSSLGVLQQNQNSSKHTPLCQSPSDRSSTELFKNSFEGSTPVDDDDLDAEGETDDEYQPPGSSPSGDACGTTPIYDDELDGEGETDDEYSAPTSSSSEDAYRAAPHYPTPSSDDSSSQQAGAGISQRLRNLTNADKRKNSTTAVKTGRVEKGKSGARTTLNTRQKQSIVDQLTCEVTSGVTNEDISGVTDEDISDVTDEDTSDVTDEDEVPETVFTKFAAKKKRANVAIKKQGALTSLAQRLGHDIRVVHTGSRVSIEGVYWYPPQNDLSIPSSHQAKFACVQNLVAAMCNNQDVKDKPSTGFLNRWGDDASHYTQEELHACAWDMVDFMVDLHTNGWTQKTYDHKLREQWQQTMFSTFEERFETLVILLSRSKRTCDDIMKRERFYTAIGNPWEIEGRSSSNSKSNADKGKKLKILTNGEHPEIVEQVKLVSSAKRKRDGEPEDVARASTARPRKQTRTRK